MNKAIIGFVALLLGTAVLSTPAHAFRCADDPDTSDLQIDKYEVDIKAIDLCADASCSTSASVIQHGGKMNIANLVNPVLPPAEIPYGTYSHISVTISKSITIAAKATLTHHEQPPQVCVTKAGVRGEDYIGPLSANAWLAGDTGTPQNMIMDMSETFLGIPPNADGDFEFITALPTAIEVTAESDFPEIDVQFNAARHRFGLMQASEGNGGRQLCGAALGAPSIGVKISPMLTHQEMVGESFRACSD